MRNYVPLLDGRPEGAGCGLRGSGVGLRQGVQESGSSPRAKKLLQLLKYIRNISSGVASLLYVCRSPVLSVMSNKM